MLQEPIEESKRSQIELPSSDGLASKPPSAKLGPFLLDSEVSLENLESLTSEDLNKYQTLLAIKRELVSIEELKKNSQIQREEYQKDKELERERIRKERETLQAQREANLAALRTQRLFKRSIGLVSFLAGLYLTITSNAFGPVVMGAGLVAADIPIGQAATVVNSHGLAVRNRNLDSSKDEDLAE
ncbi:hypothetical protein H6G89_19450 [Oscillatoria sp. FACHB-1407]|uniref:hypothetical protein n=1 Tax=Oscillatoria sp. FACHB-1407 TaxID=2692847 RepID=UPI0016859925|nr:hypothetical protein [Oscillatoria sp. FACHB-1407]MBD2463214.1 hypothetical protein [Oscillatoria sp. FACHB-1407]